MGPFSRVVLDFRDRAQMGRTLAGIVRDAGPLRDTGPIRYCDNGADLVGLPEHIAALPCTSCVQLAVHAATIAHQAGHRVDLCFSTLGGSIEHAWIRVDGGEPYDPSALGGLVVPPHTYRGAVIVPVEARRR